MDVYVHVTDQMKEVSAMRMQSVFQNILDCYPSEKV